MGSIVVLESLTFGLGRLVEAARSHDVSLVLLTRDPDYYWFELAELGRADGLAGLEIRVCDTFDRAAIERELAQVSSSGTLHGLIASTDTWGVLGAEIAAGAGLPVRDPRVLRLIRDKTWVRNRLHESSLSAAPAMSLIGDEATPAALEALRKSLAVELMVVKDSAGTGSENVWLVGPGDAAGVASDIASRVLRAPTVTCEPYFPGPLFSAEVVSFGGEHRLLAVSGRITGGFPGFREDAVITPVSTVGGLADIEAWCQKVMEAVGYDTGFSHTEFVLGEDGPEVIEINPRLGGVTIGEALCRAYRLNVYEALVEIALGERPSLLDAELHAGVYVAQALVYPSTAGRLVAVQDRLDGAALPASAWHPTKRAGTTLPDPVDQRAAVGVLLAEDSAPDVAILRMLASLSRVQVVTA